MSCDCRNYGHRYCEDCRPDRLHESPAAQPAPPVAAEATWINDLAERWLCDMRLESMEDLLAVIREARAKSLEEAAGWIEDAEGMGVAADFKADFAVALNVRLR